MSLIDLLITVHFTTVLVLGNLATEQTLQQSWLQVQASMPGFVCAPAP